MVLHNITPFILVQLNQSKVLILARVTIALISPQQQCEGTTCYKSEETIGPEPSGD